MAQDANAGIQHWIPLSMACRLLAVNQSTLRQWADRGHIRAFRTPGGHRRFSRDDIYALLTAQVRPPEVSLHQTWSEAALRRIRRRLHTSKIAPPSWFEDMDEQGRARMRLFGRRLLDLATESITHKRRRSEVLAEARSIGETYGEEMARRQMPLRQVVEAFAFFRNSLTDVLQDTLKMSTARDGEGYHLWQQVNRVADEVLVGVAIAYGNAPEPSRRSSQNSASTKAAGG